MFGRKGRDDDNDDEMDLKRRIAAGNKVNGALVVLMRKPNISTVARLAVHNVVLVPARNVNIKEEE